MMRKFLAIFVFGVFSAAGSFAQHVENSSPAIPIPSRHTTLSPHSVMLETDSVLHLTNLVIFVRFADDEEITHPFGKIDSMFNSRVPEQYSVYNYFKTSTYGKILFHTVYAGLENGSRIVSYVDEHPRGYYQPYSDSNTIGYKGEIPFMGICMREAQLLAAAMHHVDSLHLVDSSTVLDGNGDGYIDNVSFVVKGGVGNWSALLWPHMEYFPQDSIDYPVSINGLKPNAFNMEFEGSASYFKTTTFCHEMHHSLGVPDLYHYTDYTDVWPFGRWDIMCHGKDYVQTGVIIKSRYLHMCGDPAEITEDGTYTLLSNGSSPVRNGYYIRSEQDSTQWFIFEFRNRRDWADQGIDTSGLIVSRWDNSIPNDYSSMYANPFFDNDKQKHLYWMFRPGSASDTVNGRVQDACFSREDTGRVFGPGTDPYPYLTDGRPEESFEITDLHVFDDSLTFRVHFFRNDIIRVENHRESSLSVRPNPASEQLEIQGQAMRCIEVYNTLGQQLCRVFPDGSDHHVLPLDGFPAGMLLLRVTLADGGTEMLKVVKRQ